MKDYMLIALKEANKSIEYGDVPVGCVIVKDDKIIAKAYNEREKKQKITKHAEIVAIEKASNKLHTWHLDDCILYTTLSPCFMCTSVIMQSRIKKVIYGVSGEQFEQINKYLSLIDKNYKNISFIQGLHRKECLELLQKFFKEKRKK